MIKTQVTHALPGTQSQLGESPFWHPVEKALYWIDIPGQALRKLDFSTGEQYQWPLPSEPGCVAPTRSGGLVIALRDGVYLFDQTHGLGKKLVDAPYHQALCRFNDGRCDSQGRLWVGDLFGPKTAESACLYVVEQTGNECQIRSQIRYQIRTVANENITANGLAFSPDNATAYWAHTAAHRVDRFALDASTATLADRKPWLNFPKQGEGVAYQGRPDGAAVDVEGNYWVAMYEGYAVLKFSPGGELLQRLELPVPCLTMPCFGGEGLQTLFITTANRAEAGHALHPDAGKIFTCRVDVPGLPVQFFNDLPAKTDCPSQ